MNALSRACDRIETAEPVSAEPSRLREQIQSNRQLVGELERQLDTMAAVRQAAESLLSQAPASGVNDPAVKELRGKVDRLVNQYDKLRQVTAARTDTLDEALDVSEKFWSQLDQCQQAIREIEDELNNNNQPSLEINELEDQQQMMAEVADHLVATKNELENVEMNGNRLVDLVGQPDKPMVQKTVDEIGLKFDNLVGQYENAQKAIAAAYERTHDFNQRVALVLDQLKICEDQYELMGHIPGDIEMVKQQVAENKDFREGVLSLKPTLDEIRKLGEQLLASSNVDANDERANSVIEPLDSLHARWEKLLSNGMKRSSKLELALLEMGCFDEAVQGLSAWLTETEEQLDQAPAVLGDATAAEFEMEKLLLLQNDLDQHRDAMENVQSVAQRIIASEAGATASRMRQRLGELEEQWQNVLIKARDRQSYLDNALRTSSHFNEELDQLLEQLSGIDSQLAVSRPIGGTPETANQQMSEFLTLQNELKPLLQRAEELKAAGEQILTTATDNAQEILKEDLEQLDKRCKNITEKSVSRKKQLEKAVADAVDFADKHEDIQSWLSDAEMVVMAYNQQHPVGRALSTLIQQQEEHKKLQMGIQEQADKITELDTAGTHLQYFAVKSDAVTIKNMLVALQHRWDKLKSRVADRTALLDSAMRDAKQFEEDQKELCDYLDSVKEKLEAEPAASADEPERIKQLLQRQRDINKIIDAKQPNYDAIVRQGQSLIEKANEDDRMELQNLMVGLKERWADCKTKASERQQRLEDALLLSGQFRDALQELQDWLARTEPLLLDETSVRGDADTVGRLLEEHGLFENQFAKRAATFEQVKRQAVVVLQEGPDGQMPADGPRLQAELADLENSWQNLQKLAEERTARLTAAKETADKFASLNRGLLEWLSTAEARIRSQGSVPVGDRGELVAQQADVRDLIDLAEAKMSDLQEALQVGRSILDQCHPDAILPVKQWMTVLENRWDEVTREVLPRRLQQLDEALSQLVENEQTLSELLAWLTGAEATLKAMNEQPIPNNTPVVQQMLKEHEEFESEMNNRKSDVDRVTKNQRRLNIPVENFGIDMPMSPSLDAGLKNSTRGHPTRTTPSKKLGLSGSSTLGSLNTVSNEPRFADPQVDNMYATWRRVWLLVVERRRRLLDALAYCKEVCLFSFFLLFNFLKLN